MSKNSEDRASFEKTHGHEESIHKYHPPQEGPNNGSPNGAEDEESSMEVTIDEPNDRSPDKQSEVYSTPDANYQRMNILQSSSVIERSRWKDPSVSPLPRAKRGLCLYFSNVVNFRYEYELCKGKLIYVNLESCHILS